MAAWSSLALINDILDPSKVEAGKLTVAAEELPRDRHCGKNVATVFVRQQREGPGVSDQDRERSSCHIAYPTRSAGTVLKNLLSNAFKSTRYGSVTLELHRPDAQMELQRSSIETPERHRLFGV